MNTPHLPDCRGCGVCERQPTSDQGKIEPTPEEIAQGLSDELPHAADLLVHLQSGDVSRSDCSLAVMRGYEALVFRGLAVRTKSKSYRSTDLGHAVADVAGCAMKTAPDRRLAKCRTVTSYELSMWHRRDPGHRRAIKHYKKAWHRAIRRAGKAEISATIVAREIA